MIAENRATDFFVVGGTLTTDASCYVQRPADQELYNAIQRRDFCYVLTSRQMGKSSLMIRTAKRLREQGIAVAVLELTALGLNVTPEQWYEGLLSLIGQQLGLEADLDDFWFNNDRIPPMRRFFLGLRQVVLEHTPGSVVVLVDEVDTVRSLSFSADEFFAGIRECYNRRVDDQAMQRLSFGIFGVASPSNLIQNALVTPFNIGTRISLTDFRQKDAQILAQGLGANGQVLLDRILYWTGGHPYLTIKLCNAAAKDTLITEPSDVDRLVNETFFVARAKEADDNLLFVRRWLLEGAPDVAAVLDLYRKVRRGNQVLDQETNALVELLHLSGIVRSVNGRLKVRNRIYERVFDDRWTAEQLPGSELRRQREAFLRGVFRIGVLSAFVLGFMISLTIFAFREKARADRLATQADNQARAFSEIASDVVARRTEKPPRETRRPPKASHVKVKAAIKAPLTEADGAPDMYPPMPMATPMAGSGSKEPRSYFGKDLEGTWTGTLDNHPAEMFVESSSANRFIGGIAVKGRAITFAGVVAVDGEVFIRRTGTLDDPANGTATKSNIPSLSQMISMSGLLTNDARHHGGSGTSESGSFRFSLTKI